MSKIIDLDKITPLNKLPAALGGSGIGSKEPDLISRINQTIENFRGLVQLSQGNQVKFADDKKPVIKENKENGQQSEMATLLQILIAFGFGNKPIGELLKSVEGKTINQILEVMQSAIGHRE